ncbi:hypothetical protein [Streptomyces virginiae]
MSIKPEFEIEIEGTKVYLRILTAARKIERHDGQRVEQILGRVQISTDRDWEGNTDLGFRKVRGRKYAIESTMQRLPENQLSLRLHGSTISRWTSETYVSGYRNDKGQYVKYDAQAYDSLAEFENDVLTQFEKDHPDWQTTSARRLFEVERDRQTREARRLRSEADETDAKAAEWQKRIDDLGPAA